VERLKRDISTVAIDDDRIVWEPSWTKDHFLRLFGSLSTLGYDEFGAGTQVSGSYSDSVAEEV
jgi:hypothetical protein